MHGEQEMESNGEVVFRQKDGLVQTIKSIYWSAIASALYRKSLSHAEQGRKKLVTFSDDMISHQINIYGVHEGVLLDALFDWLTTRYPQMMARAKSEGTVIDGGANIGNHSLYFSDHFGKVIAFEPNPATFDVLKLNAQLVRNVETHRLGLSDEKGSAQLSIEDANMGASSIVSADSDDAKLTIDLECLDDVLAPDENVLMLKLDVEGHEFQALGGAKKLIERAKPIVMFEQLEREFVDGCSPVVERLRDYGYHRFVSVRETPDIKRSVPAILRHPGLAAMRLAFGNGVSITSVSDLKPDFYPLLIALPDWLENTDTA
ncbi:MAG: FkbM family methyltransferase [Alphaproteobacteria bacterium]